MSSDTDPLFEVRLSPLHGEGAFALRDLPQGTTIGIYEGRRYSSDALLLEEWEGRNEGMTYLFALSDGTTIDGAQGGNATRHLNHACQPNCEAVEVNDATGGIVLTLVTTDGIPEGAELFLDYGLVIDEVESPSDYPCRCGGSACRGSMAA